MSMTLDRNPVALRSVSRSSATPPHRTPTPRAEATDHAHWANLVDWQVVGPGEEPLYEQVIKLLREQILLGVIPAGSRLPSTRQLMERLGVSRTTVIAAYAQ